MSHQASHQDYPRQVILVTGGRNYRNRDVIHSALEPYARVGNILVQGGATGADRIAARFWFDKQLPYVTHPAPWDRAGRAAGPMRSRVMVDGLSLAPHAVLVPDVVIAFPGGPGTAGTVRYAQQKGITVERHPA